MNSLQSPANQSIPSRSFKLAAKYCFMWKISLVLKKKKNQTQLFFAFCKNYSWTEPVDAVKCWIYLSRSAYISLRLWQEQKFVLPSPINQRLSSTVVRDFMFPMSWFYGLVSPETTAQQYLKIDICPCFTLICWFFTSHQELSARAETVLFYSFY